MIAAAIDEAVVSGARDRPFRRRAPQPVAVRAARFAGVALAAIAATSGAAAQERKLLTDVPFICVEARIEPGILPGPYSADELRDMVTLWFKTRIDRHLESAHRLRFEPRFGSSILTSAWTRPECKLQTATRVFVSYARLGNGAPFRVKVKVYHHRQHAISESAKDLTGLPGAILREKNGFYIGQDIDKQVDFIWSKIR